MSIDTIGNFLTIIRNAIMASKPFALAPNSRMNMAIAKILVQEGFIAHVEAVTLDENKKRLKVTFKYVGGESAIHSIDRVSKPSRRIYEKVKNIKPTIGGLGISILSTNRGVITDKQARDKNVFVGGELICRVW
jgi:small subunit ribosomal protein S8